MKSALRIFLAAALAAGVASPSAAEWTKAQRARFLTSCVEGCQSTPGLSREGRAACPKACDCLADQGEKMMTPADFEAADAAAADDKMTPKMEQLARHFAACARKAAGR